MNRQLTEDLHQYFEQKTNPTPDENYLLARLTGELPYFPISHMTTWKGKGLIFQTLQIPICQGWQTN